MLPTRFKTRYISAATAVVVSVATVIFLLSIHSNSTNFPVIRSDNSVHEFPYLICRLVVIETMYESEDEDTDDTICVPFFEGNETLLEIQISVPQFILENAEYFQKLQHGTLFANITNVTIRDDILHFSQSSDFKLVDYIPSNTRRLSVDTTALGSLSIAIIRISTIDSSPSVSRQQMLDLFNDGEETISFPNQFRKCSAGNLEWQLLGVFDVTVQQPISNFTSGASIVNAAVRQMQFDLNTPDLTTIADRIMFCAPPGTGSWVASAGLYHWRAQFNDEWCLSISAAMHELAHTLGLLHSNKNGVRYADTTGNMAKSFRSSDAPLRCFNGRHNHLLGWYRDREMKIDPITSFPSLVKLAAFVDYDNTEEDEPVLISLAGDLHLQFNRAKSYNQGTGEKQDMVTITSDGSSGTELLVGLNVGDTYIVENFQGSVANLLIEACDWTETTNRVDIMTISIGIGPSRCGEVNNSTMHHTQSPSLSPVHDDTPNLPADDDTSSSPVEDDECAIKTFCKLSNRIKAWVTNVGTILT